MFRTTEGESNETIYIESPGLNRPETLKKVAPSLPDTRIACAPARKEATHVF